METHLEVCYLLLEDGNSPYASIYRVFDSARKRERIVISQTFARPRKESAVDITDHDE